MPSSRWSTHRLIHLVANSVLRPSSGIKLDANAAVRPEVLVPTSSSSGISTWPSGIWFSTGTFCRISSNTGKNGDCPAFIFSR